LCCTCTTLLDKKFHIHDIKKEAAGPSAYHRRATQVPAAAPAISAAQKSSSSSSRSRRWWWWGGSEDQPNKFQVGRRSERRADDGQSVDTAAAERAHLLRSRAVSRECPAARIM
jgi:hypothetical protein